MLHGTGVDLSSESGLSPGDHPVLPALHEAPEHRLRPSSLAATIHRERSRLSHHRGRRERRRLITREQAQDDPRGADVVLTDDGAAAYRRSSVAHLRAVQELFLDACTEEELADLQRLTSTLRRHLGLDPGH
ncbi:DNA-binding MarR family transcriptional regulator [Kineococcus rhizosphaerae]|uniref:DNA-binding MarR family transcriptional regulator n=1 Tax=Kineococcus rhizosphaerae TaxID=559628 RepID=A0A2T0RAM2_9ACTN|nr:DNA-binding MarR family transcriptional regulator [Kineococcus rhizosphaerae]